MKQQLEVLKFQVVAPAAAEESEAEPRPAGGDAAVRKIVAEYLQENPGAGMPAGVQAGYELGGGVVIRSAPNPKYANGNDDSKIPFELRIRGRVMFAYNGYKTNDDTKQPHHTASTGP